MKVNSFKHINPKVFEDLLKMEFQFKEMENLSNQVNGDLNPSVKLALAMAVVESRRRQNRLPSASTGGGGGSLAVGAKTSESDAIKWKRKAKQRKEEIIRLKEDLKIAEGEPSSLSVSDGLHHDVFPQSVSCKCYFFDNLGQLSPMHTPDQNVYGDVLRRRFLRQVRLSERKKRRRDPSISQSCISDSDTGNVSEQLRASVDFLVELCETSCPFGAVEGSFRKWSHQAIDFILATLNALSLGGKIDDTVESIMSSLIVRIIRRMCDGSQGDELVHSGYDFQFYVQHLMRKLGTEPYIGQRAILSVCQRLSLVAECLLVMNPFNAAFPRMHNGIYLMIQLIEFLISDNLLSWSTRQDLDTKLLEEWVLSVFSARKAFELLENRNTLYVLYMDRIVGAFTRHLGQLSLKNKLQPYTLEKLFG